jgi:SAM-dependent methyltransferase
MTFAERNHRIFSDPAILARNARPSGWVGSGEAAALMIAAPHVRGGPVLDIGVGTGRTVELLALLTDDYIGIDYTAERVAACRCRYPGFDFRHGDARHLDFGDGTFQLTFFSFNGIDTLDHDDRRRALDEMRRVTREGGIVCFSTLNRHGQMYGERPWELHRPGRPADLTARNIGRLAGRTAQDPTRFPRRLRNWRAIRHLIVEYDDWAVSPLSLLDYRLMNHFVSLTRLRVELSDAGLRPIAIFGAEGSVIVESSVTSSVESFYVVARPSPRPG